MYVQAGGKVVRVSLNVRELLSACVFVSICAGICVYAQAGGEMVRDSLIVREL